MIAGDLLGERARLTPDKTALVFVPTGRRYTYAELDAGSCAIAAQWVQLGLKKGERVCILAEPRPEYVQAFFAAGKTGIVVVPLNSRNTARELAEIVADCAPSAILYSAHYEETVRGIRELSPIPYAISMEEPAGAGSSSDCRLEASATSVSPEDICCLLYTSGTTGKPKGVMIPHRQVVANARNTAFNGNSTTAILRPYSLRYTTPAGSSFSWCRCSALGERLCCTRSSIRRRCGRRSSASAARLFSACQPSSRC